MKKYISLGIGIVFFFSPIIALAQTASVSDAWLIASLTALIQILEQELQQLLVAHGSTATPTSSTSVTAMSASQSTPSLRVRKLRSQEPIHLAAIYRHRIHLWLAYQFTIPVQ